MREDIGEEPEEGEDVAREDEVAACECPEEGEEF